MAVGALSRSHAHLPQQVADVPPPILLLTLVPLVVDLLSMVQTSVSLGSVAVIAAAIALAATLGMWLRLPQAGSLAGASFAALASLVMRLIGADVAPLISLLSVLALGLGGAFASSEISPEVALR